ncbi:MAG: DUF368 domain-containing protein [Cellulosilyticaceae bacterium]
MEHIKNVFIGMVLGVSNVIPGVSAGTMAVVMNIYDKLLDAVSLDKEKIKQNFMFLMMLGIGVGIGIIAFSNGITYLFDYYPMQTQFAFIGVILGSIPMIIKHAKQEGAIRTVNWIPCLVTFGIMVAMVVAQSGNPEATEVVLKQNFWSALGLFVSGAISAFAMIIPGISGSFIMVTLGTYHTVINAITHFNLPVIAVTGVGVLVGLFGGIKLVKILLEKYNQATYMAILGLVIGSVLVIYPGFAFNSAGMVSLIVMILGMVVAYKCAD